MEREIWIVAGGACWLAAIMTNIDLVMSPQKMEIPGVYLVLIIGLFVCVIAWYNDRKLGKVRK